MLIIGWRLLVVLPMNSSMFTAYRYLVRPWFGLTLSGLLWGLSAVRLQAVEVGESREAVIAEMGPPLGQVVGGNVELLRYADQTIKLRDGRVRGVAKSSARAATAAAASAGGASKPTVPSIPAGVPSFPHGFVGSPEFHTRSGVQEAGTAFFAREQEGGQIYILTAHHLLGPDGGFPKPLPHDQVPSFVSGIRLHALFGQPTWHLGSGCVVPGGDDRQNPLGDLAVFRTVGPASEDVPILAKALPKPGENVWVIAHVRGGVPEGTFIHLAKVVEADGSGLFCEFENSRIITNGASGAPVINEKGEVVGVYSGHVAQDGHVFAAVIPSPMIIGVIHGF